MTEQIENYIKSHIDPEPDNLYRLYRRVNTSLLYSRMCSGHLQGRLLKMLTAMINPMRVLEIGTYAGYSALCIAEGLRSDDARVDTIEIEEEMESTEPTPEEIVLREERQRELKRALDMR